MTGEYLFPVRSSPSGTSDYPSMPFFADPYGYPDLPSHLRNLYSDRPDDRGATTRVPTGHVTEALRIGRVSVRSSSLPEEVTSVAARDDAGARKAQHEKEVRDLQTQVSFLEEEISVLRRKLAESPRQVRVLEERLHEAQASLAAVTGQNERLVATLKEAREQIIALKEDVDRLAQPPSAFGTFLAAREDGTVDIFTGGRKLRVNVSPGIEIE